jgi:hypothetical protein
VEVTIMIPVKAVYEAAVKLLGDDTATLSGMATLRVALVKESFTPGPLLEDDELVYADFVGSTAKTPVNGNQAESLDPANGDALLDILPPSGGWLWECTTTPTPAQTIYGFALRNTVGPVLYASELLDQPVEISAANQSIFLPAVRLRFAQGFIS